MTKLYHLYWNQLTPTEKNELAHIWIFAGKVNCYVPDYCGDWNLAMAAVQRLRYVSGDRLKVFMKDLPDLLEWTPEILVYHVMKAYGYKG